MNQVEPEHLPLDRDAKILDEHPTGILAIEKPAGVLTHPNRKSTKKSRSLLLADYDYSSECYVWSGNKLFLVHRLDSPTSGVLLACRTEEVAKILHEAFARRKVRKTYHAVVKQKAKAGNGEWKDRLEEFRMDGKLRVRRGKGAEAVTRASFEREKVGRLALSLLRLEPHTGRTHQLRVQAAARGFPIVGDRIYGDFSLNRRITRQTKVERLCLHASSIEVGFSLNGERHHFASESALPRAFGKLIS